MQNQRVHLTGHSGWQNSCQVLLVVHTHTAFASLRSAITETCCASTFGIWLVVEGKLSAMLITEGLHCWLVMVVDHPQQSTRPLLQRQGLERAVTSSSCTAQVGQHSCMCLLQASTVAAGVSAYLIKSDLAKLDPTEMAHYFEDRIGKSITTAWNLNVKDVEQTISGVCQRVSLAAFHLCLVLKDS